MKPDFSPTTFHAYELAMAFHYLSVPEMMLIRSCTYSLPSNPIIVNIGAGSGTSSLAMAESRKDAVICTIDISSGGPFGGLKNERNAFAGKGLPETRQILGDSSTVGMYQWDKSIKIDMLMIDGDHSHDGCLNDFNAWKNHVKPGGLILFHDYERDEWPDVKLVVDNIVLKEYDPVLRGDTLFVVRKPIEYKSDRRKRSKSE